MKNRSSDNPSDVFEVNEEFPNVSTIHSQHVERGLPVYNFAVPDVGTETESCPSSSFDCHSTSNEHNECTFGSLTMEKCMRRRLRFFFMNPTEKCKTKGRIPYKLALQIVKIVFITLQLYLFGSDSYKYEQQKLDAAATFRHIFLKDWTSLREVASYPPASGIYAAYTKPELYDNINHVVWKYSAITNIALGSYGYDSVDGSLSPMQFCKSYYRKGKVWAFNASLMFDNTEEEFCIDIPAIYPPGDERWENFSLENFLIKHNHSLNFDRLIKASLSFSLKTVFLKSLTKFDSPDCYLFRITVEYDNTQHDGQIPISLSTSSEKLICNINVEYADFDKEHYVYRQLLNAVIIVLCCGSFLLCCRSLIKAQRLRKTTVVFFKKQLNKDLSISEQLKFLDLWYVMMIGNDVLIIAGSALKIQIEQRSIEGDQYTTCAILLGTGNLLVWAGVLRYLGFFPKYNVLILTLKCALPNVLRFMFCALLLYGGFCFCGWVVLGPYHIKFRSLSTTSECLFAMMNGDDLFATFAITNTNNLLVWWFSRIYLYLFISLFIYVVISLFIAVIMDSYETIKSYYQHGFPQTELQEFISQDTEDTYGNTIRNHRGSSCSLFEFFKCCHRQRDGYEPL